MKRFYTQYNIGKSKYIINYTNGKVNNDGSPLWDIMVFKSKKIFEITIKEMLINGYKEN